MNLKNIILSIVITIAVLGGIIWLARPDIDKKIDPTAAVVSALTAPETSYDFGTISMVNGDVSKIFTLKNSSPETITIEKIYTSCMCTEANLIIGDKKFGPFGMPGHGIVPKVNQELKPGEEAKIEAIFDPKAHGPAGVGPIDRVVYVEEKDKLPLELKFKAVVTP